MNSQLFVLGASPLLQGAIAANPRLDTLKVPERNAGLVR
jgi:hypothetical protein